MMTRAKQGKNGAGLTRRWLAALAAIGMVASSCGSDSEGVAEDPVGGDVSTAETESDEAESGETAPDETMSYQLAGTAGLANDAFWITFMCGGTAAAEAVGSTIDWFPLASSSDASVVLANRSALILGEPDGIVFTPDRGVPYEPGQIERLMEAGTPVTIGNSVDESMTGYLGSYVSSGQDDSVVELGGLIAQNADGGSVLVLGGLPGSTTLAARWEPARDAALAANPELEFLDTEYEEFDINSATQIVSAALIAHPDLAAIFAVSGPAGQGAVAAVQQAEKSGDVLVYSFDATPVNAQALRDGTIKAILSQPAALMGAGAVDGLLEFLNTRSGSGPVAMDEVANHLSTEVITLDNVDAPEVAGYLYSATCES